MYALDDTSCLADITQVCRDVFQDDDLVLQGSTGRTDVEQWDSMNHLNLLMALEQRYRIKFSLGEIEAIQSVGDILALIRRKTGAV
jgi:acyl carrier protein